jgi:hypothetical protein
MNYFLLLYSLTPGNVAKLCSRKKIYLSGLLKNNRLRRLFEKKFLQCYIVKHLYCYFNRFENQLNFTLIPKGNELIFQVHPLVLGPKNPKNL